MDNNCAPFINNSPGMKDRRNLSVDYHTYKSIMIAVPLIAPNGKPDRIRKTIYFVDDFDLSNKEIVGINCVDSSSLTKFIVNNISYTALTTALTRNMSLTVYDRNKKHFAIPEMPLCSFISPATVTNMKFPFHRLSVFPDMKMSYLSINSITGFNPAIQYVALLNVYYR